MKLAHICGIVKAHLNVSMQVCIVGCVRKNFFFELTLVWSGFPFVLEPEYTLRNLEGPKTFSMAYGPQKEWESRQD